MSIVTEAKHLIARCKRPLVLTGAGISAASGVPTSAVNHSDTSFLTTTTERTFLADPFGVWQQHLRLRRQLAACVPNVAHRALADWAKRVPHPIITQNIDGLHERSGHPHVVAYHGTIWENRCIQCAELRADQTLEYAHLPASPCHPDDFDRPNITWIGDGIFPSKRHFASCAAAMCSLVLVIGTSLEVSPFNLIPQFAKHEGAIVIGINPQRYERLPTLFDIQIEENAEDILPFLLG